jgi:hypothetical protein
MQLVTAFVVVLCGLASQAIAQEIAFQIAHARAGLASEEISDAKSAGLRGCP